MELSHTAKLLSLYERGVITAPEVANSLLTDLIREDDPDLNLSSYMASLPDEVRRKLRDLLRQIQQADYRWRPFMLGPGGTVLHSATDDSLKLRRLCMMLETARSPAASSPE